MAGRILRGMLALYVAAAVIYLLSAWEIVAGAVISSNIHLVPDGDLRAINTPLPWFDVAQAACLVVVGFCALSWVGVHALRWRRATGEQRQQVKWLIGGASTALLCLGFMLLGPGSSSNTLVQVAFNIALPVGLAALPVSIAVGILRSRLYEIDVIIKKTLVYAALAGTLAIVYLGAASR